MTKKVNGVDVTGIFRQVQDNRVKLNGCAAHRVDPGKYKLGQKMECENCHGTMNGPDFVLYAKGYAAAGGDPNDVWPGLLTSGKA